MDSNRVESLKKFTSSSGYVGWHTNDSSIRIDKHWPLFGQNIVEGDVLNVRYNSRNTNCLDVKDLIIGDKFLLFDNYDNVINLEPGSNIREFEVVVNGVKYLPNMIDYKYDIEITILKKIIIEYTQNGEFRLYNYEPSLMLQIISWVVGLLISLLIFKSILF